jgi:hypothetical protein
MVNSSLGSKHVPTATFPTVTSTLAQPLRRTSTSQSQRSTSSSSTGQVGSRRPRILCLECGRHNCMVQLPSARQHQHSPPAHNVIPAVNPISVPAVNSISASRLSTSSHGKMPPLNNPLCYFHLQQTPLQPTLLLIFRTPSTWFHPHTWKTP